MHDVGRIPIYGADKLPAQFSLAINHIGLGPTRGAIHRGNLLIRIANRQEIYVSLLQKEVVSIVIDIDTDAEYDDALCPRALLHGHQGREFFYTRRAPRRPKVQDQDLAAKLIQTHFSVGVLHTEIAGSIADVRRSRPVITAGGKYDRRERR